VLQGLRPIPRANQPCVCARSESKVESSMTTLSTNSSAMRLMIAVLGVSSDPQVAPKARGKLCSSALRDYREPAYFYLVSCVAAPDGIGST
jgi:hypothetical protein